MRNRIGEMSRKTKETDINVKINLDGTGKYEISTGIGIFDHFLSAFALHGGFDLEVKASGDLHIDAHHTVEDTGIVLGLAFRAALESFAGINRFGQRFLPMDEALVCAVADISGRPFLVCKNLKGDKYLTREFLRAFAYNAEITLHTSVVYGDNAHHIHEALYKALARALREAIQPTSDGFSPLSTKGVL